MATVITGYGMEPVIVAELPKIIEERYAESEAEGRKFITLTHQAITGKQHRNPVAQGVSEVTITDIKDSFKEIRIKLEPIFTMREMHPGEIVEP